MADVHRWNKADFPCCCFVCLLRTWFHSFSTVAFASGINIAWVERSFAHTLGFPRQRVWKTFRIFWTMRDSRFPNIHSTPFVLWVHPRLVEENIIRSLYSPGFRVTRRILSHRYAMSRNETASASFHLEKIKWRLSFRSFHWSEFVYQNVIPHRIPSFFCNINTNEFCFRHFDSCYFGTTVSCLHVREYGLFAWNSSFSITHSCFFLLWAAFPILIKRHHVQII